MVGFHLDEDSQIFIYMQHGWLVVSPFPPIKNCLEMEFTHVLMEMAWLMDDTVSLAIKQS